MRNWNYFRIFNHAQKLFLALFEDNSCLRAKAALIYHILILSRKHMNFISKLDNNLKRMLQLGMLCPKIDQIGH